MIIIVVAAVGIAVGLLGAIVLRGQWKRRTIAAAQQKAGTLLAEANAEFDSRLAAANAEAAEFRQRAEQEFAERETDVREAERKVSVREEEVSRKETTVKQLDNRITNLRKQVAAQRRAVQAVEREFVPRLADLAGVSVDQAHEQVLESVERVLREDVQASVRSIEAETKESAEMIAHRMLGDTVQRLTTAVTSESSGWSVTLTEKELNRASKLPEQIEELAERANVSLTLDEEASALNISATDAVNRELAKRVFAEMLKNGRRQSHDVERMVERHLGRLERSIREDGIKAAKRAGVKRLPDPVVETLGRLTYRYSYGQNQLLHAVETARLAAMLAHELGADIQIARAGGLLHDLGKAIDRDVEGTHAALGAELAREAGMDEHIAHCIEAHHEEIEPETTESLITIIADAASGARPGARRESLENYLGRLEALESVAYLFPGVEKCYAIQAGRELRVIVNPDLVGDEGAARIAGAIGQRIQDTLDYPGQIKVVVIRESRVVEHTH